jgi:hypothetical protein
MAKKKIYRFTGKEGKAFSNAVLQKMIKRHQDHHEIRGQFFGRDILTKILEQPDCMGIRFYYAINEEGQKTLVLVGADAKGASMWPSEAVTGKLKGGGGGNTGGDAAYPCPPWC